MQIKPGWLLLVVLLNCRSAWAAQTFDHTRWDDLLHKHVITLNPHATAVDYQGMASDSQQLDDYLERVSQVSSDQFNQWNSNSQLAFLINVYNAATVQYVLAEWPSITSIKELGNWFQSPWKKPFITLLGETRSLDDIEHKLIRGSGRYPDPRIHFAINCASIGCPALREEAYQGQLIEQQLMDQTQRFLSDQTRHYYRDNTLYLSSIFKWYEEDFEKGWLGYDDLQSFLLDNKDALALPNEITQSLNSGNIKIRFLPYDWRLNSTKQR